MKNKESKEYAEECGASWQVSSENGVLYKIKCRHCGVLLMSGGTPKCLKK